MTIQLYKGDCLEVMDVLIAMGVKVDAIITDPPYGTTACKWDIIIPFEDMWKRLKLLRKDNTPIVLFGSEPFSSYLRLSNIKEFKYDWIWEKSRPSGIALRQQPMRKHETISIFANKVINTFNGIEEEREYNGEVSKRKPWKTWNTGKSNHIKRETDKKYISEMRKPTSVLKFPSVSNFPKNLHPTQKPVDLMEYLIKTYTNEGDTVLDFTIGSGTTGVACKHLNRNFIGIELNDKYFEIAKNRIDGE